MPEETSAAALRGRLQQRERELEAARRVGEAVRGQSELDEIVRAAVSVAVEVIGGRAGSVLLADPDRQRLVFRVSVGDNPVEPGTSISWSQGIAGQVFHSGEARIVRNVAQAPEHFRGIDALTGFKTINMFALPLRAFGGPPIGVMEVLNKEDTEPAEEDISVLMIIATFATIAIEQTRLFEAAKLAEVAHRLSEVGHDIKNMLMPVNVGVDLLHQEVMRPPAERSRSTAKEAVTMVKDAVHRIQDRVRLITQYVKGRSVAVVLEPCLLPEVVEEVLSTLRLVANERRVTIQCEGLNDVPTLLADRNRLYTALYNLVDNAIPEVGPDGFIAIRARLADGGAAVLIEVQDTGKGMQPEVRDSLFSDRVRSRKRGGTGLGTKIVQDVVHAHGGQVSVSSEPGKGTIFSMRLPIRPVTRPPMS